MNKTASHTLNVLTAAYLKRNSNEVARKLQESFLINPTEGTKQEHKNVVGKHSCKRLAQFLVVAYAAVEEVHSHDHLLVTESLA